MPKNSALTKETSILIVGAGVFGLSTALHLSRTGYKEITVIDPHPVPSPLSAATDINKIIRTEYHIPLYGGLAREAYTAWNNDPLFKPHFHKVCTVMSHSCHIWANIRADGVKTNAKQIKCGADLKKIVTQTSGSVKLDDWIGIFNPEAGWAHSGNALISVANELKSRGVRFIHGNDGTFESLHQNAQGEVDGIRAASGRHIPSERVVLAMGASTGSRIGVNDMLRAYGYALAMIQLEPQEAFLYKDMPCLHSKTHGYIFEPSVDGRLKFALPGRYAWYGKSNVSRPEALVSSYNNLPPECIAEMRELLATFLPHLADRPFCYSQLCWDADSSDDNFLITFRPDSNKVLMATGGSYHGFKFFPTIGRHVVAALEGKLSEEASKAWKWRPEIAGTYKTRGAGETRVLERHGKVQTETSRSSRL
uniref:FAD dependent oxidoreductase domain-containing protein n=1 Tax=Kwoniella bestiolae CBS 10118 TaxID=1296100 RepID=A0A1B9FVB2_9TREE|nr:hypothetical protein I302_08349 [Kwoniella bestiolae CBS 10118]OCF22698.1 hypothetical protein I302_08349 [Kwoniella bestiolae CBS 10118]